MLTHVSLVPLSVWFVARPAHQMSRAEQRLGYLAPDNVPDMPWQQQMNTWQLLDVPFRANFVVLSSFGRCLFVAKQGEQDRSACVLRTGPSPTPAAVLHS